MKETAAAAEVPLPGWVITAGLAFVALLLGFATADNFLLLAAGAAGIVGLIGLGAVRLSLTVKLVFVVILVSFLQRLLGYFKIGELRGANVANLLLLMSFGAWFYTGLQKKSLYRSTPIDLWLLVAVVVIPSLSLGYAIYFRRIPGYIPAEEIRTYKQWVTPFIYFFLLIQSLETKRDVKYLFALIFGVLCLVVLEGMPDVVKFSNWRESRSEGIVGQANDYAALLATTIPFFFLLLFLYRERMHYKAFALLLLGCMGISILMTYSRAGYAGLLIALAGTLYIAYRATRRVTVVGPAIVVTVVCLLPVVTVPEVWESLESRFTSKTYKRSQRKGYTKYEEANQFSGGRFEIWKGAIRMAEDHPIFGVGFHAFRYELPRYHYLGWSNYPHNQFLGALAEGGIVWLVAICTLYWKLWRLLYHNWKVVFSQGDRNGMFVCGGALVSFIIMTVMSTANDFFNPGPKSTFYWVIMAGAIRYAMIAGEEAAGEASAQQTAQLGPQRTITAGT